jgi:glutathione synthase/RimK-type ligase-like ATP-grasp enzyme
MGRRILILTEGDDVHAIAVAEALNRRGAEATLWPTANFPMKAEETIHFNGPKRGLRIKTAGLTLRNPAFDVVWRRRPGYVLDATLLNPADRQFADAECSMFRRSLLAVLAPEAFWVNSPEGAAKASSKIVQHQAAAKAGLQMPETLYTNSPREVRAFIKRKDGRVVYKPFLPTVWQEGEDLWLPYTALLTHQSLIDDSLRLTPGIFQELVTKTCEVRLTMIGQRAFAAKVFSQETMDGRLDWRRVCGQLRWEPCEIPAGLKAACLGLMQELGIVFGCFDFAVTPDGEYIFLEVNEMGQFLFIERYCGLPLLDAFVSFLLEGRVDFSWDPRGVDVRYSDPLFEAEVLKRTEAFAKAHVTVPPRLVKEEQETAPREIS